MLLIYRRIDSINSCSNSSSSSSSCCNNNSNNNNNKTILSSNFPTDKPFPLFQSINSVSKANHLCHENELSSEQHITFHNPMDPNHNHDYLNQSSNNNNNHHQANESDKKIAKGKNKIFRDDCIDNKSIHEKNSILNANKLIKDNDNFLHHISSTNRNFIVLKNSNENDIHSRDRYPKRRNFIVLKNDDERLEDERERKLILQNKNMDKFKDENDITKENKKRNKKNDAFETKVKFMDNIKENHHLQNNNNNNNN